MSIYGIGARFGDNDVTEYFVDNEEAGIGWNKDAAPDLHQFIQSLKVGDIVYIKSHSPSAGLIIKAIGIIKNNDVIEDCDIDMRIGRKVHWICTDINEHLKVNSKLNVRNNSLYEEFHPIVQDFVLNKIFSSLNK
ncbi:hypothetical protein R4J09_04130 [Brachyspira intermedia]|uniref:hypothetical protein n=1 Tax=Brachyspira intermedia TaxID=84377 RepID=UPI0030045D54